MSDLRSQVLAVQNEVLKFVSSREKAQARVAELNPIIEQWSSANAIEDGETVLGEVLDSEDNFDAELRHLTLAAIYVPGGIGTIETTQEWGTFGDESAPLTDFKPFENCRPIVQARLLPEIDKLFTALMTIVSASARPH